MYKLDNLSTSFHRFIHSIYSNQVFIKILELNVAIIVREVMGSNPGTVYWMDILHIDLFQK